MKILNDFGDNVDYLCECGTEFNACAITEENTVFLREGDGKWPNIGRLYPTCPKCQALGSNKCELG